MHECLLALALHWCLTLSAPSADRARDHVPPIRRCLWTAWFQGKVKQLPGASTPSQHHSQWGEIPARCTIRTPSFALHRVQRTHENFRRHWPFRVESEAEKHCLHHTSCGNQKQAHPWHPASKHREHWEVPGAHVCARCLPDASSL